MCHRGHPLGQCLQNGRGTPNRVGFDRFATGEHQNHKRTGQVLTQQHGGHDGNAGQQVGTKLPPEQLDQQVVNQRDSAQQQGDKQGNPGCQLVGTGRKSKPNMQPNCGDGEDGNGPLFALPP